MAVAPDVKLTALVRLADWSYRRRRYVLIAWILLLFGTVFAAQAWPADNNFSFFTPGAESSKAQDLIEAHFPARSGDDFSVVFEAKGGTFADQSVQDEVGAVIAKFAETPHVKSVESPLDPQFARQIAPDGTIGYATMRLDVNGGDFKVTDAKDDIKLAQASNSTHLQVELSGFPIQNGEQGNFSSEGIGLLVAMIILLVAFASVLAAGLPILIAAIGLGIGLSLIALLSHLLTVPDFAPQVASMIGIGVGIDYVLFIVTRYRSALHEGLEPRAAVATAMTTSGRAVIFAGCTVIISLLGLFVMNLGFLRGLAVGASSAVLVVMLAAVTLLPAMLGFLGKNIDKFKVPFVNKREIGDRRSLSYRWSRVIQKRPWTAAIVGGVALLALAAPLTSLYFGFPDASNSPTKYTTRRGYDLMAKGFGAGFNGPVLFVANSATPAKIPAVLGAVAVAVQKTDNVAFVAPATGSPDKKVALMLAFPKTSPQSKLTEHLVHELREHVIPPITKGSGVEVLIGGQTGGSVDNTRYVADRLPLFIGAVIVLSFLLLMVVFHSVLVPLKAAVMNLLSVGSAYGVVSLLVKGGTLGHLIGINDPTPVPSFIPMMMFAILFGLSMDYEVFLLSRVREEYVRTGNNAEAVADGLAHTARVITAAALIMISVFLAFVLNDQVFLKMIGVGLATAIFVDATLVRMVLVPATMELLGDRNWWMPEWLGKRLPTVHVEGESADAIQLEIAALVAREHARKGTTPVGDASAAFVEAELETVAIAAAAPKPKAAPKKRAATPAKTTAAKKVAAKKAAPAKKAAATKKAVAAKKTAAKKSAR